jgi:hypothetical protein
MTAPCEWQTVQARLARLERENRWMKRGFLCLGVALAAVFLLAGQAPPPRAGKTVEAERFVVVDADGKKRGVFGVDKAFPSWDKARPTLALYGKEDQPAFAVNTEGGSSGLFFQEDGETRLGLAVTKGKFAGLVIYRNPTDRKSEIGLFYSDDGKPALVFNDPNGRTRAGIILEKGDKPILSLQDENGKIIFSQAQR